MNTRKPAVAGHFYPDTPSLLQSQLDQWLTKGQEEGLSWPQPIQAIIAPHAGYLYSGSVAAEAYQYLKSQADRIRRVILIGPSHRYYFNGCAIPSADFFATPLGNIKIDTQYIDKLKEIEDIEVSDQVHAQEHSLEVQLPFLQSCLHDFTLLPLLTSNVSPTRVANIIDALWQGNDCLLVVSSDLSHFHPYATAQRIDSHTCDLIENHEPSLTPEQACGSTGINTLLMLAKKRGYQFTRKAFINSGDTAAGDKEKVVGYVSYLITDPQ